MARIGYEPTHEEVLNSWSKKSWLYKLFLPRDFRAEVSGTGKENLVCEKRTREYLVMQDREERLTLKVREANQYGSDFNYRPADFKNLTLKLIRRSQVVTDRTCGGMGVLSCPTDMDCRRCKGTGRRDENCKSCDGQGQVNRDAPNWNDRNPWDNGPHIQGYASCGSCWGSGRHTVDCGDCYNGRVTCDRCYGSGEVVCSHCDGVGIVVDADVVTRSFHPLTERNCCK